MPKIIVLAIFAALIAWDISFSKIPDTLICENRKSFYGLWKDAALGKDPNKTEQAAWVILSSESAYSFQQWPPSVDRNSETWSGPVPDHAVALVHTHPVALDAKPSRGDIRTAQKLGMPLYVISSKGIWKVDSHGHVKKQSGPEWSHQKETCNVFLAQKKEITDKHR